MDILTLDFETYYDRYYSLSRITTEEYIRHELFEAIGVSVKVNDEPAVWFSGTKKATKAWLDQFNWGSSIVVAHNAMFDMAILSWEFDIRPKMIADTLSMARALHASEGISLSLKSLAEHYGIGVKGTEVLNALGKGRLDFTAEELDRYGAYCVNDAELTYKLFAAMAPRIPKLEAKLIDLTMRMFTEPTLELDKCVLEDHLKSVKEKKEKLLDKALVDKANLMSNPQLAKMLEALGVDPPMKTSPATGKETFAFAKNDEEFKALLEHEDFIVQAVVAARLGVKSTLEETRTERFLQIAERGTLPVPLRYYAAHTGRWGGDDKVNLQNLPRKSPLKKAMRAPDGYLLVDCDSSQIEARTLAWLAEQGGLVQAFEDGEDVYKIMAASIYGKPVEEITEQERFVGKTTILGCLAEGTPVLTDRGWVAIEEVTTFDQLWDGEEWVCHQGLVQKGTKETLNLCGLWLTPDHRVLCGTQWLEAQFVAQDKNTLSLALGTGVVSWLSLDIPREQGVGFPRSSFDAIAGNQSIPLTSTISRISRVHAALCAVGEKGIRNDTGNISPHSPILHIESGYSTDCLPLSVDVTCPAVEYTPTTEAGVSLSVSNGEMIAQSFSGTPKQYLGGITPSSTWTARITTEGMSPVTSGLSHGQITTPTVGKSAYCRRNLMTYDIAYAGPRNRYTVATDAGPIIVHNCGYGMGAKKFRAQLKTFSVDMDEKECERIIGVYREDYPMIPKLWSQGNAVLSAAMNVSENPNGQTAPFGRDGVLTMLGAGGILMPNGLHLRYPNLKMRYNKKSRRDEISYDVRKGKSITQNHIYGGKVVENICQALARIIIGEQMLMVARRYKVVMTVHDAVGALVPEAEATGGRKFIEDCMRIRPKWALGLPLNCESKIGASYGG